MSDDHQLLSYEEMVSVLQRSTVLQNRTGLRPFSREEVLQAAGELGLDEGIVARVTDEHLARRSAVELAPRPFNTRIQIESHPEALRLTIPPLPLAPSRVGALGFLAFFFAFAAFWTNGALRGGALFAAFSIPLWGAGAAMAWRCLAPMLQTTRLWLERDGGRLRVYPLGRSRALRTSDVRVRIGDHLRYRSDGFRFDRQPGQALLLEHGTETIALLADHSEQEQRWVESELRAWLLTS